MMDRKDKDKKGFWGGLLRSGSLARRGSKMENKQTCRVSGGDAALPRASRPVPEEMDARQRRKTRRPEPESLSQPQPQPERGAEREKERERERENGAAVRASPTARGKSKKGKKIDTGDPVGRPYSSPLPLTQWPPRGISSQEELAPQHALELICRGAPTHKGHKRAVPHVSDQYYALYCMTGGNRGGGNDTAHLNDSMAQLMTLRMQGQGQASLPWETLEQPSYSFFYGQRPGTITLNQWASMSSVLPPTITLRDSGVRPRVMDLEHVCERLKELQAGLEDDDESLLYRILYRRILRDPDKILSPHRTLDRQITDLILVLSRPDWVDFTDPKNQVVTRFLFSPGEADPAQYHKFLHQLLLSLELELRIHSRQHGGWAKEKLLQQIPPTIQWNLALARRWRENVRVERYGTTPDQVRFRYKLKKRQIKMLKRFAQAMKWPNLADTLDNLKQRDEDVSLDSISSDAFAFFSGLVLPGPTFPFLIMNTLIDLDPDPATDDLALLSHMHPHCGFQYRNSYTYWSASCVVGKVLAPTCRSVAGWVGPGRPTADLGRSQIARVRSRRPRQHLGAEDVESMGERSDALGPPAEAYPVHEYALRTADSDDIVDTVRIELLGLKPVAMVAAEEETVTGPRLFDATLQFAIDGASWPLRLMYDVSFISAWPCSEGPHLLFFDYVYTSIKADEIVGVRDWGGLHGQRQAARADSTRSSPGVGAAGGGGGIGAGGGGGGEGDGEHDDERVLVVEAFGVRDNEVLGRAWCSHWGLSAVVADIRKTCMACAIREAYAATLTVVILVDDQLYDDDDE